MKRNVTCALVFLLMMTVIQGLAIHNLVNIASAISDENSEQQETINQQKDALNKARAGIEALNIKVDNLPK